jgi:hypothetical protein
VGIVVSGARGDEVPRTLFFLVVVVRLCRTTAQQGESSGEAPPTQTPPEKTLQAKVPIYAILAYSNIRSIWIWRKSMDNVSEWTEQLLEAESKIAEAYTILATLQADLKMEGRKKDTQAIGEVVERLARYGRLFEDIRQSWAEVE